MNRAEIAREQTKKQRQIIEYHKATMEVYSEINQSIRNGEFEAICTISNTCLEQIVSNLIEEGFIVDELTKDDSWTKKKITIRW